MATILIGAGALAYDQIKKSKEKRAAKRAHNDARFVALEKETSARLASSPTSATCACDSQDDPRNDCPIHGSIPPPLDLGRASSSSARSLSRHTSRHTSRQKNNSAAVAPPAYVSPPASPTAATPSVVAGYHTNSSLDNNINGNPHNGLYGKRAPSFSDMTTFSPPAMATGQQYQQQQQPRTSNASGNFVRVSTGTAASTGTGGDARRPSYMSQTSESIKSGNFVSISSGGSSIGEKKSGKKDREARGGNSNFNVLYDAARERKLNAAARPGNAVNDGNDWEEREREKERINEERRKGGKGGSWWRRKGKGKGGADGNAEGVGEGVVGGGGGDGDAVVR